MLPNFILIGVAKCGTTSLSGVLAEHPEVFVSEPREIGFFGMRDISKDRAWYESHFEDAVGARAIGEGSTIYTHPDIIDKAASEIRQLIPDCRLIFMVRHPLRRLESDWRMRKLDGECDVPINEAVDQFPTIVRHGFYFKNISAYRRIFQDDQILVVFLEDFKRDPESVLNRCFEHIGVPARTIESETHRLKSAELRQYGGLATRIRQLRFFETAKNAMPQWMLEAGKKALTKEVDLSFEWDAEVRQRVVDGWSDDVAAFLDYCGKPGDFWKFP